VGANNCVNPMCVLRAVTANKNLTTLFPSLFTAIKRAKMLSAVRIHHQHKDTKASVVKVL